MFEEIAAAKHGQWMLYIERRAGSTYMQRRLAQHFLDQGRDVRVLSKSSNSFEGIPVKQFTCSLYGRDDEVVTSNTVLLVDGLIKWDPSHYICEAGGLVVVAHSKDFNIPPRDGEQVRKLIVE